MKAVILAGGRGTRLNPITLEIPKPLLPVKKQPIINHLINLFLRYGIADFAVTINEAFLDDFKKWRKEHYPTTKIELVVEKEPIGTFGAVVDFAKTWAENEAFFVTNGDELKEVNLADMIVHHRRHGGLATIALRKVPNPGDYGVVVCDRKNRVRDFLEKPKKPPSNYISAGLYLVEPALFERKWPRGFLMFEQDVFPRLLKRGELFGYPKMTRWQDCGTFQRWQEAIEHW